MYNETTRSSVDVVYPGDCLQQSESNNSMNLEEFSYWSSWTIAIHFTASPASTFYYLDML